MPSTACSYCLPGRFVFFVPPWFFVFPCLYSPSLRAVWFRMEGRNWYGSRKIFGSAFGKVGYLMNIANQRKKNLLQFAGSVGPFSCCSSVPSCVQTRATFFACDRPFQDTHTRFAHCLHVPIARTCMCPAITLGSWTSAERVAHLFACDQHCDIFGLPPRLRECFL